MRHLDDDDLVLHYYGEDGPDMVAHATHLQSCAQCAQAYDGLVRTLSMVTAPELVEPPDDIESLRQLLLERGGGRTSRAGSSLPAPPWQIGAIALAWLAAALYPFSYRAVFASAEWAEAHLIALPLVVVTMLWACAGPVVAAVALHRFACRFDRAQTRVLTLGAVMAAISPALYLVIARVGLGLPLWYGALAAVALAALVPWPVGARSPVSFVYLHRLSALVLTVFLLGHVINQALAFVSLPAYTAMRSVMRLASQQPVSYAVIVSAVAIQMLSGAAMGMKRVRAGAFARNLQAVSGWYLAVFLFSHVLAGFFFNPPAVAATPAAAINQFNLLASDRATAQLPYYVLGVAAFLFHVGIYARLAALNYLPEASVRRLSYAATLVGTTVVVTIGLALCGVHLPR